MPDSSAVTAADLAKVVKTLLSQINNLAVSVMTLRAALMQAHSVPVPTAELQRLHKFFENWEPIRQHRESIERLGPDHTVEELDALLKNYKGPIQ